MSDQSTPDSRSRSAIKPVKYIVVGLTGLVALALIGAVLVPILFRDQIVERLRRELNAQLDATVAFSDIDVSFLTTFPTLTAEVTELSIVGKGDFEDVTLFSAESVGVGLDIAELVFERSIVVKSIVLQRPEARIVVNEDGRANYDIVEPAPPAPKAATDDDTALRIERYEIARGLLEYREPGMSIVAAGIEHRGRAELAGSIQTLVSETHIDALSVVLGPIRYLKKAKADASIDAVLDTSGESLMVRALELAINELMLEGAGRIGWRGDGTDLDLELASKKGLPIKALISTIPNAYSANFAGLKGSGTFAVNASVKGQLGPDDDDIPSFSANARVSNAAFKYPDLPLGVSELDLDAKAQHPGGGLDRMRLDVSKYGVVVGKSHGRGRLVLTKPLSGPHLELTLDGRFDAAEISQAYPIPDVRDLEGVITAAIELASKGERIEKLTGQIAIDRLRYQAAGSAPFRINEAQVSLTPEATRVQNLELQVGESDLQINGIVSPLTVFLGGDGQVTASAWLKSKRLKVEDFLTADAGGGEAGAVEPFRFPEDLDAKLAFDVGRLTYGDVVLDNFKGNGRLRNGKLELDGVRADALGGSMKLDGSIATPKKGPPRFDLVYGVDRARFSDAFDALPTMQAYAPIARYLDGRFSADVRARGTLDEDLSPRLSSIDASGLAAALQSRLTSDFAPLAALNQVIPAIPKPLDLEGVRARFEIEDGTLELKPTTIRTRGVSMEVRGSHGLDQEMRYQVASDIPLDDLPPKLAKQAQALRLDLTKAKTVGVRANLTGTVKQPRVSVELDTAALRGVVADAVSNELAEQSARALEEAEKQARRAIEEAEKRAAQIRSEAKKAAERLRKEGYARADQVEREGAGNPLKAIAAKEAAKRLRRETDKRADQVIVEANKRADQAVAEAKKRAEQSLKEAAKRTEQGSRAVEGQTDRVR